MHRSIKEIIFERPLKGDNVEGVILHRGGPAVTTPYIVLLAQWVSVCFPLQGVVVCALGVQPTLTLELRIPVSAILLHW